MFQFCHSLFTILNYFRGVSQTMCACCTAWAGAAVTHRPSYPECPFGGKGVFL
ncbi:MAG: hypothetical protein IJ540_05495 [Prevotella sp.]|nr:hypothetical protein [Prevotella sp.]